MGTTKKSAVIPEDAKAHFWTVVRECLVEFHKNSRAASQAKVRRFRRKVEASPKAEMELFYHNEPFDIACRIAEQPLSLAQHLERYIEIRDVKLSLESSGA